MVAKHLFSISLLFEYICRFPMKILKFNMYLIFVLQILDYALLKHIIVVIIQF